MNRISPLRAGLEAINKFRLNNTKNLEQNPASTNPFGISFKGNMLQMDVFESSAKENAAATNPIKDSFMGFISKTKTMGSSIKNNMLSFGGKIKDSAISFGGKIKDTYNKLASTEISLNLFGNSVSSLQKRPVSELESMLKTELARV